MSFFKKYLERGLLKKQSPNLAQISKQIERAFRDLKTAKCVLELDPEWAATMAYQSMLRAGRALLFANGYLPIDGAQHRTVVEVTGKILNPEYASLIRQFEKLRKKRNLFFYDSEDTGNLGEAKTALETAKELLGKIKNRIEETNSQIRFDF